MSEFAIFQMYFRLGNGRNFYVLQKELEALYVDGGLDKKYTLVDIEQLCRQNDWDRRIKDEDARIAEKLEAATMQQELDIRTAYNNGRYKRITQLDGIKEMVRLGVESIVHSMGEFSNLPIQEKIKGLPALTKALAFATAEERIELDIAENSDYDNSIELGDQVKNLTPAAKALLKAQAGLSKE